MDGYCELLMGMNEVKTILGSVWLLLSDGIGFKQGC